jgi:hypothetical protein
MTEEREGESREEGGGREVAKPLSWSDMVP